jgi:hypothetical protein
MRNVKSITVAAGILAVLLGGQSASAVKLTCSESGMDIFTVDTETGELSSSFLKSDKVTVTASESTYQFVGSIYNRDTTITIFRDSGRWTAVPAIAGYQNGDCRIFTAPKF